MRFLARTQLVQISGKGRLKLRRSDSRLQTPHLRALGSHAEAEKVSPEGPGRLPWDTNVHGRAERRPGWLWGSQVPGLSLITWSTGTTSQRRWKGCVIRVSR